MPDMADDERMLGKLPAVPDRQLKLLSDVTMALPPPPVWIDWTTKLDVTRLGTMLNTKIGCCTISAMGHAIQVWTANDSPSMVTVSDTVIGDRYRDACGWVPGRHSTDNVGGVETKVLNHWLRNPLDGHVIEAAAAIEPGNNGSMRDAIWLFGGVYVGIGLPLSARSQTIWSVPQGGTTGDGRPWSWGGHAVFVCGYNSRGVFCITWGQIKRMTWNFVATYMDEAYAILAKDWTGIDQMAPSGFNRAALISDLNSLRR